MALAMIVDAVIAIVAIWAFVMMLAWIDNNPN